MANIVQPTNQQVYIDPYSSRLFDMGVQDTRIYLSRQVNFLLRAFGTDVKIRGLDVTISLISNSTFQFTISPGVAIVDTTLLEFKDPTTLTLDLTGYDTTGNVPIAISYKYIQTLQANLPYFKTVFVTTDGSVQLPDPWEPSRDRLVLAWLDYQKDSSETITNYTVHLNPNDPILIGTTYYYPSVGFDFSTGRPASPNDATSICGIPVDCSTPPNDGDLLSYDAVTNRWVFIPASSLGGSGSGSGGGGGGTLHMTYSYHLVTSDDGNNGFFVLPSAPADPTLVSITPVNGVRQIDKQSIGSTGVTPDFDILNNNEVHINNNAGATGLSGDITAGDILMIDYMTTNDKQSQYITLDATIISNGYFALPSDPADPSLVTITPVDGVRCVNKQIVGSTGLTPDYDVLNTNEVHINTNGGATGLSNTFNVGDVILVEWYTTSNMHIYYQQLDNTIITNGYFTISLLASPYAVNIFATDGIKQINKRLVGSLSLTPDYDVLNNNEVHINTNGGATGLSNTFNVGDIILVEYWT